jgi:hypothetical protein
VWTLAVVVALLMHLGAAWVARALRVLDPSSLTPEEPELIEVVFTERPKMFTELPDDRAEEPPEDADLLSNVDSRARDDSPGGDPNDLPKLEGQSEVPQVRMDTGEPQPSPSEPAPVLPEPQAIPRTSLLGTLARELVTREAPRSSPTSPGQSDIFQEEMSREEANALLSGEISLSTTEWDFAPWLKAFRRAVTRRWRAPAAYYMGLIDGWTEIELEVMPNGTVRRVDVIGQDVGHRSLTTAAVFALEGAAPYRALPSHFPEESLVIQIRFMYPRIRR